MTFVSVWSAENEGRVRGSEAGDDGNKRESMLAVSLRSESACIDRSYSAGNVWGGPDSRGKLRKRHTQRWQTSDTTRGNVFHDCRV